MVKRNYQKELEQFLGKEENYGKRLLLHSCCAPCSSYVLIYLRQYFRITVFYYNPNITDRSEYEKRVREQERFISSLNEEAQAGTFHIEMVEGAYEPSLFMERAKGLEGCPEGGERCHRCFALRLGEAARYGAEQGFDFYTTTLTISPLKNAPKLNEIGEAMAQKFGVKFLPSDFKKKEGYKQSIELSKKYDLYRQNYCGCVFSKEETWKKFSN